MCSLLTVNLQLRNTLHLFRKYVIDGSKATFREFLEAILDTMTSLVV